MGTAKVGEPMKTMFGVLFEGIIKKKSYHERELLEKARKKNLPGSIANRIILKRRA
jgi:hypothetical protein